MSFKAPEIPCIKLGNLNKLTPIPWDYPLSSIIKLVPLTSSYILALDWYCSLHIIPYLSDSSAHNTASNSSTTSSRGTQPSNINLYCPSIGTSGHPQIYFTLQYLHLREKYAPYKPPKESHDIGFFSQLDYNASHYINVCVLEPGIVLFKPTKEDPVYYIDFTSPQELIYPLENLSQAWKITKVSRDIVIYQDQKSFEIFLYALNSKKAKLLNFKSRDTLLSIGLFGNKNLVVAGFEESLEVLNLSTNKLLEKVIFVSIQNPQIASHDNSSLFVLAYLQGKLDNKEISLEVYNALSVKEINGSKTTISITRNDPVQVMSATSTLFSVKWLDADHLLLFCKWDVILYRVKKEGIIKLSTVKAPFDFGYEVNTAFTPNSWCFAVLDPKYFAVLTADERWGSLQMNIDLCKVNLEAKNNQLESVMENIINVRENRSPTRSVIIQGANHPKNEVVKFEPTRLISSKSDYIRLMCCWNEELVIALSYRNNLLKTDLTKGKKLEKIANISGLLLGASNLVKIRSVKKDVLALIFEDTIGRAGLIVLDMKEVKVLFNSFGLEGENTIQNMRNIEVLQDVSRIIMKYEARDVRDEHNRNIKLIGEIEYWKLRNCVKELIRVPIEKESETFVNLGNNCFATDDTQELTTISFYSAETKRLIYEKDFEGLGNEGLNEEEKNQRATGTCFVDNLKRVNNDLLAFYYYEPGQICIYNWKKDAIVAKCLTEAESILRIVGNSLIFVKEEERGGRDHRIEGSIGEINLRKALNYQSQKPQNLVWKEWLKYMMVIKEECFWSMDNGRKLVLVERKNFPSSVSYITKVNKSLELLRVLKKQFKDVHNYYIVQYVHNMIIAPNE